MDKTQKTLLIMAGGTGGHVFPALSVATEMDDNNIKVVWLGTKQGIENRLVPEAGYPIEYLSVNGLVGSGMKRKLTAPFMLILAFLQACKVIIKHKPDCVLGMGGFASGPGGVAAKLLGRSLVIHEQNAYAGLTNRKLAKLADTVLTGFRSCEGLPENSIWVGNPVRSTILAAAEKPKPAAKDDGVVNLLILGGSQGANSLNINLPESLVECTNSFKVRILHQTGNGKSVIVNKLYQQLAGFESVLVEEFIEDMEGAYRWADLVVCRAGAMTISELMAMGKPAILVPYPYAAGDHQSKNARIMVNAGAAVMLPDNQLGSSMFIKEVKALLHSHQQLQQMGEKAKQLHRPKAAKQVATFCWECMHA